MAKETKYRLCPLCEATCGLELTVEGREVLGVRGNDQDPFSKGYLCPKGVAIQDLDRDPDRLREPMIREGATWRTATWDEAFAHIQDNLMPLIEAQGKDAVGVYLGNPSVHNTPITLYLPVLLKALGSRNIYSASTVDQMPKQLASAAMFGTALSIPLPDIDRTDFLMILGANPLESNGSLLTAPDFAGRLKKIQKRGGKIVSLDPRLTKTAKLADEHHFIQPGTDALFLFGIVNVLVAEDLCKPGRLAEMTDGLDDIAVLAEPFTPEAVAPACGIDADTIRRLAREIAASKTAAVYARIGASTQEFGTLANWLPEVIHLLTGNLDREGGAMFTLPAHGGLTASGTPGKGRGFKMARRLSRVRQRPEIFGEFPVACLAEEIETPGEGQIRALITVAGNPALSSPNSGRITRALESLDFMVSFDIYLNETTRHANVILPGVSPLERCQYNGPFTTLSVRNHARYSPAMFPVPEGQLDEWQSLLRLAGIVSGMGPDADLEMLDTMVVNNVIERESKHETSSIHGRDTQDIVGALGARRGPERLIDVLIRTGPYGDGFGAKPDGLTLDKLEANPHGFDFGALEPRLPGVLRTATGQIELTPDVITGDIKRLEAAMTRGANGMVLIGRRHLRSNNSWMHNSERLVSGKPRCTMQIHPEDAARIGLEAGSMASVSSRVGTIDVPVEITDEIMSGVVSIPHGWGHDAPGARMAVARAHAGVNSNILTDESVLDEPSGNAVLCGIPVTVVLSEQSHASGPEIAAVAK